MNLQGMLDQLKDTDRGDDVGKAAADHVADMPADEVADHLQSAADKAAQAGQDDTAQELLQMVEQRKADPDALKNMAVGYIKEHPEVLQHFAPSFAQGILNRFL
ncbi:MAG: hypothetical protein JO102_07460 [Elusimicrobia bacterium]|nr:hypothetical protein [Elusimicrobiota bacterium]